MLTPDEWVIVKIKSDTPHYRVFASWRGGYLEGERWRMNSGIIDVEEDSQYFFFKGNSGSVYRCHKLAYGIKTPYNMAVLRENQQANSDKIEILEDMPDVMNMNWIIK